MNVLTCLTTGHNLWLVGLAALVCALGIWITTTLVTLAGKRTGRQRRAWLFLGGVAGGSSIWCTHFIAELAYDAGTAISFEPILTMLSLLVAIVGCTTGFGFAFLLKKAPEFGGAVFGASIAAMHYTGMAAYHVDGIIYWDRAYVMTSIAIAVCFSAVGVGALLRVSSRHAQLLSFGLLLLAVVGLHFTGMTALTIVPSPGDVRATDPSVIAAMAIAVAGVAVIIASTGIASYSIDNDSARENIEKLRFLAMNDGLTGLPNRASFAEYLRQEITKGVADGSCVAVLCIDLDRFKEINDIYGHHAGDTALRIVGERIGGLCGDGEFVARIGGDEFSAVKRYQNIRELHEFVRRIEAKIRAPLKIDGHVAEVGSSIGVSIYPQDGAERERLMSNADMAMYRAKSDFMRKVCFYEPAMDEASRARRDLGADLKHAVANGECKLFYQVQNSVLTGAITGYEVLLRWKHPVRGFVSPVEFIPLAEESGLIQELGEWVLRTACHEAASWAIPYKIAVNISPLQFIPGNLARIVRDILEESKLSPSRLELEITESTIIADKERTLATLKEIRAFGVTIAIDDFGTGYSSLETLRSFPFDKIKLDRSFMREKQMSAQSQAIIRAVLALGKSLQITVLAEGVEFPDQLSMLRREGCDEAQGYFLGKPMAIDDMNRWQSFCFGKGAQLQPNVLRALAS